MLWLLWFLGSEGQGFSQYSLLITVSGGFLDNTHADSFSYPLCDLGQVT